MRRLSRLTGQAWSSIACSVVGIALVLAVVHRLIPGV